MPTGKFITKEDEEKIIEYYNNNYESIANVAKKFGLNYITVQKILSRNNVKLKSKTMIFNKNLNEHYFENIDNEEKAYILGLLITDGNVYKPENHGQDQISIASNDKEIVDLFAEKIGLSKKVNNDGRGSWQVCVKSNIMSKDLEKYGVVPRKSFITKFPVINDNLYPHLIRGIIDGDGNISFYPRKNSKSHHKAVRIFSGSEQFLKDLNKYLTKKFGVTEQKIRHYKTSTAAVLSFSKLDDIKKILDYIYNDSNYYLQRKKEASDNIISEIRKYRGNPKDCE